MNKKQVEEYVNEYGIEPSVVNNIYESLHDDERITETEIKELMPLICYDYMHLDVQSNVEILTDKKVNEMMNNEELTEMKIDMMDDELDRLNDLSTELESIININVEDYLDRKSGKKKENFFDNLPRE